MKQQRPYPIVTITKKSQRSIEAGHPWVYAGEVVLLDCTQGFRRGCVTCENHQSATLVEEMLHRFEGEAVNDVE